MQVYFLMDAILSVKRVQYFEPSFFRFKYSRNVLFVGMFVFSFMIDINAVLGIQSFNIPYNSNMPIIEAGDFVVADLRAYERRRPDYGDLVVFYLANQTFCYRVVGIPNDHVRLEKNSLIINSKRCEEHFLKDTMVQGLPLSLYEETLPNGRKHLIYKDKTRFDSSMANTPNCFVYTDNYYLLGDHRDYAMDSRMFGMIKQTQIIGQLVFSIWGEHGIERANISLK
jgi:signal peptidase I